MIGILGTFSEGIRMLGPREAECVVGWLLVVIGHSLLNSPGQRRNKKKLDILRQKADLPQGTLRPDEQEVV